MSMTAYRALLPPDQIEDILARGKQTKAWRTPGGINVFRLECDGQIYELVYRGSILTTPLVFHTGCVVNPALDPPQ